MREGVERLRGRGLIEPGASVAPLALSASGLAVQERLLEARRRSLTTLVADWESEAPELDAMIERLADELCRAEQMASAAPS